MDGGHLVTASGSGKWRVDRDSRDRRYLDPLSFSGQLHISLLKFLVQRRSTLSRQNEGLNHEWTFLLKIQVTYVAANQLKKLDATEAA